MTFYKRILLAKDDPNDVELTSIFLPIVAASVGPSLPAVPRFPQ